MPVKGKGKISNAKSAVKSPATGGQVEKIPTGIQGFDAVLEGGVPKGRVLLITGSTGTGKTVFSNEFLYRGITEYNENGVYVTFEEHPRDIIKNVANFGWDFDILIRQKKLVFVDASPDDMTMKAESEEYDLSPLVERIKHAVRKVKAKRVAIDALSMLFSQFAKQDVIRAVIYNICNELRSLGVTTVITAEKAAGGENAPSRYGVEEFVVDGVAELALAPGQQQFLRKMFIRKIRGVGYRSGVVEFEITNGGLEVFPKIVVDRRLSKTNFKKREKFGIKGVDEAIGGGIPQGHMVLISGNAGTGKTLFVMHFIVQGIKDGQSAVYIALEEPIEQIKKTAREFGFDFDKYEKEGKLFFICPNLIDMYKDRVLNDIVIAVNKIGAKRVVIDSISSLKSANTDEESVRQFLIQASGFFKSKGIACVTNYLSGANFGAAQGQLLASLETSLMRLSSIVDGIIVLLYVERGQRVKRILNILKMRGSWHSNEIFQFEVQKDGINSESDTKNRKCIVRPEKKSNPPTREQLVQELREQKKKLKSLEKKVAAFRQTEDALLESDKNLSAILEESADGTVIVDADGTVLYVNPAAEKLFGRAKKGFVGFPFGFPVSKDKSEDHLIIRTGDRLCEAELRVVQMHWNNRVAFQLSVRDITDRKRAEAALEEALERHQLANRATFDVIWDWNFKTDALLWNPNYQIVFGYQPDEIPPGIESRINRIHPEDRDRVQAGILAAIASGAVFWSGNYRYCRRDGHYADVEDRAHISRDSSGAPVRMVGAMLDVTERKQADQELRKLSAAMEQSSALVMITSHQGDIEYVNPRFTVVTGYTLEEVRGKNPRFLKSGDKSAEDYHALWETITSGQDWHGEFQNRKKDGTLYWEQVSISPMRNAEGAITHFISVKEDITAHKALEAQFLQAQKMESIGRLAGGTAHDFNNMLQVIGSYAEIAMMKIDSTHALYNHFVQIQEATRRSTDLTRQLLAFARKQAISPKVLDLNDTVSGMLKIIRRLIGENIELAWLPGADVWHVKMDPSQIDQILANLTVNSRDAISGTGKVTIETTNAVFDEAYCALHAGYIPGEYIMLAVSDNGTGMTKETIAHLFEPFFTTKGLGKGTGLGTATVFGIVKQNKGFISVYSEPGVGTTFKIYLPRFLAEGVATRAHEVEAAPPRGSETVLIVEDEAAILGLARLMLEELGYTVLTAGSPGEAIRLAAEDRAEIHLVITDVVMPEMNGRELMERIGKLRPGLKYLFMSGYMENLISQHGVLDEGVRFIQKPFSRNDLACKVREALEQS